MKNPYLKQTLILLLLGVVFSLGIFKFTTAQITEELEYAFEEVAVSEINFFNYLLTSDIKLIHSNLKLIASGSKLTTQAEFAKKVGELIQTFPALRKVVLTVGEKEFAAPSNLTGAESQILKGKHQSFFFQPYSGLLLKFKLTPDTSTVYVLLDLQTWFKNKNKSLSPSVSLELLSLDNTSLLLQNIPDRRSSLSNLKISKDFQIEGLHFTMRPTRLFYNHSPESFPLILLALMLAATSFMSWRYFALNSKRSLQDWDYQESLLTAQTRLRENYKANFTQEEDILCCLMEVLQSPHWDLAFAMPLLENSTYEFLPILGKLSEGFTSDLREKLEGGLLKSAVDSPFTLLKNISIGGGDPWPSLLVTKVETLGEAPWLLCTLAKYPFKSYMSQVTFVLQLSFQLSNFWDFRKISIAQETSEARSKAIVETSVLAIITINHRGAIQSFNPAAIEMFGYSLEEVLGQNINMLMPNPYHKEHDGYLANYLNSGKKKIIGLGREVIGLKKSGDTFPLDLAVSEMKIGDKRQFLGLITDISDRKRSEKELKVALDQANEANQAKSVFLANMSHEIRTPMNSVLGMAELLGETQLNLSQRNYISALRASGENLLDIINAILDISKIEAGEFAIDQDDFSLRELIESSVQIVSFRTESKELTLLYRIDPKAPMNLVGDMPRIRQVLINLLSNAIKFTERGEITLEVELVPFTETQVRLQFKVTDQGIGIPADKLNAIFQSFTQADATTTRKFGGTGLGLSISKKLVELMDGKIFVESILDVGSQFYAVIPFNIASQPLPYSEIAIENLEQKKVLLIARSDKAREFREEQMVSWGLKVTAVENPMEWLQACETPPAFNYMILEMDLPHQEAIDFFSTSTTGGRPLGKRIILGPHSLKSEFDETKAFWDDWLEKPVLYHELAKILNNTKKAKKTNISKENLTPCKILLAEDNEDNVVLIKLFFKKAPYEIINADNGQIALDLFKEQDFDLVLMDMEMPVMNGLTATKEIRTYEKETGKTPVPILALTAHAMASHQRESFDAGCDGHLTKPIKKTTLIEKVEEFLNPV